MVKRPKQAAGADWPANHAEMWPIDRIIPYDKNPKIHTPEQITLLAQWMTKYGVDQPIVVDEDGVILKGHGRRLGGIEAKFTHFPVVQHFGLSEAEKRAMRVADNQLNMMTGYSPELIKLEMGALKLAGFDMNLLGFGQQELVQFETNLAPVVAGKASGSLMERFGVVPFSVLNAREGWWQDRKRAWLKLGIKSELGRGENLLKFSDTINQPDPKKRAASKAQREARAGA